MKKRWLPFLLCLLLAAGLILVGLFLSKKNRASGVEVFLPSAQSPSANDVTEDGSLSQSVSDNGSLKVPSVIKTDGLGYQVNDKKKAYFEKGEEGTCFQVVDAHTRETVFTGQIDRKSTGDFSGVTAPGIYYIEAAHVGRSGQFVILEDKYRDMADSLYQEFFSYAQAKGTDTADRLQILSWILRYADTYTDTSEYSFLADDIRGRTDGGYLSGCMEIADNLINETEGAATEELSLYSVVMASLSQKIQAYDREKSNTYLKEAVGAYANVVQRKNELTDEAWIFYAAAQLYKTTGQPAYRVVAEQYLKAAKEEERFIKDDPQDKQRADEAFVFGLVTYLQTTDKVDVDLCEKGMKMLIRQAEVYVEMTEADFYDGFGGDAASCLITDRLYVIAIVEHVIVSQEYNNILKAAIHNLGGCNRDGQIYLSEHGIIRTDYDEPGSDAVNAAAYYYLLGQICESDYKENESIRSEAMESEEP